MKIFTSEDFEYIETPNRTASIIGFTKSGEEKLLKQNKNYIVRINFSDIFRKYKVPLAVTKIGENAFQKLPVSYPVELDLTDLPQLETIGDRAFQGSKVNIVDFPSNLKEIGDYAFQGNLLATVDFSNCPDLTEISRNAFADNPLDKLILGNHTHLTIRDEAFRNSGLSLDVYGENVKSWSNFSLSGKPFDRNSRVNPEKVVFHDVPEWILGK